VLGDTLDKNDETFTVTLSQVDNATLGDGQATGTIKDDDSSDGQTDLQAFLPLLAR
jgi:hypothetical protein